MATNNQEATTQKGLRRRATSDAKEAIMANAALRDIADLMMPEEADESASGGIVSVGEAPAGLPQAFFKSHLPGDKNATASSKSGFDKLELEAYTSLIHLEPMGGGQSPGPMEASPVGQDTNRKNQLGSQQLVTQTHTTQRASPSAHGLLQLMNHGFGVRSSRMQGIVNEIVDLTDTVNTEEHELIPEARDYSNEAIIQISRKRSSDAGVGPQVAINVVGEPPRLAMPTSQFYFGNNQRTGRGPRSPNSLASQRRTLRKSLIATSKESSIEPIDKVDLKNLGVQGATKRLSLRSPGRTTNEQEDGTKRTIDVETEKEMEVTEGAVIQKTQNNQQIQIDVDLKAKEKLLQRQGTAKLNPRRRDTSQGTKILMSPDLLTTELEAEDAKQQLKSIARQRRGSDYAAAFALIESSNSSGKVGEESNDPSDSVLPEGLPTLPISRQNQRKESMFRIPTQQQMKSNDPDTKIIIKDHIETNEDDPVTKSSQQEFLESTVKKAAKQQDMEEYIQKIQELPDTLPRIKKDASQEFRSSRVQSGERSRTDKTDLPNRHDTKRSERVLGTGRELPMERSVNSQAANAKDTLQYDEPDLKSADDDGVGQGCQVDEGELGRIGTPGPAEQAVAELLLLAEASPNQTASKRRRIELNSNRDLGSGEVQHTEQPDDSQQQVMLGPQRTRFELPSQELFIKGLVTAQYENNVTEASRQRVRSPRGKLEENMRRVKELRTERGAIMSKACANFKKERLYLDNNVKIEAKSEVPQTGRAFKRKADVPSFSQLKRTAIREVEREQQLKKVVKGTEATGVQNEVAVQTAGTSSGKAPEDSDIVYKELITREVCFDIDAKIERGSRRPSELATGIERRSSLQRQGSSAAGHRSSRLLGLHQPGKDRLHDRQGGSLGDLHVGLKRKRSEIIGAGSKTIKKIAGERRRIASPVSSGSNIALHLERAEKIARRHASHSPMTLRLQRVLEQTYKVQIRAEPEPVQSRLNIAGEARPVSVRRSRALLASLSPERRFMVRERQYNLARAKIQRDQRALWQRLRKECRALLRRSLRFDETIWQNYDTLVQKYNVEKAELEARSPPAMRPLQLLRQFTKARSENNRLVAPFRMMLHERRSEAILHLRAGCNNPNVKAPKVRAEPLRVLDGLMQRFFDESNLQSSPQRLKSPKSTTSPKSQRLRHSAAAKTRRDENKSIDQQELWNKKLAGLLQISGFGSTFQRTPQQSVQYPFVPDLGAVDIPFDTLAAMSLAGQPAVDPAQMQAWLQSLAGVDMWQAAPLLEEQLQQYQLQMMTAAGQRRDGLNPIYEDEASQENTMAHESVKVQAHIPRTREGSPEDSQRVQTRLTAQSFAPLGGHFGAGAVPTDGSPDQRLSASKGLLGKSTLQQSNKSKQATTGGVVDTSVNAMNIEASGQSLPAQKISQRHIAQLNQPSHAGDSYRDDTTKRRGESSREGLSPTDTVPPTAVLSATGSKPRSEVEAFDQPSPSGLPERGSSPILNTFLTQAGDDEQAPAEDALAAPREPVKVLLAGPGASSQFASAFTYDNMQQYNTHASHAMASSIAARENLRSSDVRTHHFSNVSSSQGKQRRALGPNVVLQGHQIATHGRMMSTTGYYAPAAMGRAKSGATQEDHQAKKPKTAVARQYRNKRIGKTPINAGKPPSMFAFSDGLSRARHAGHDQRQQSGAPTTAMRSSDHNRQAAPSGPSVRELARVSGEKMKLQQYRNRELSQQARRNIASSGVASKVSLAELNKRPEYQLGTRASQAVQARPIFPKDSSRSNVEVQYDAAKPASMTVLQQQVSAGIASEASFVRINEQSDSDDDQEMPTSQTPILDSVLPQKSQDLQVAVAVKGHRTDTQQSARNARTVPLHSNAQQLYKEFSQEMRTLFTTANASDAKGSPSATEKVKEMESLLFADMDKPQVALGPLSSRSRPLLTTTHRAQNEDALLLLSKNASSAASARGPLAATSACTSMAFGASFDGRAGLMSTRQYTDQFALASTTSHVKLRTERHLPALTSRISQRLPTTTIGAESYREQRLVKESTLRDVEDELFGNLKRKQLGISRRAERRMQQSMVEEAQMTAIQAEHQRMNQKTFLAVRKYEIQEEHPEDRVRSAKLKAPGSRQRLRRGPGQASSALVGSSLHSRQAYPPPSAASRDRLVRALSDRMTNADSHAQVRTTRNKDGAWLDEQTLKQSAASELHDMSKVEPTSGVRSRLKGLSSLTKNQTKDQERGDSKMERINVDLDHVKRGSDARYAQGGASLSDANLGHTVEINIKSEQDDLAGSREVQRNQTMELQLGTLGQASTVEREPHGSSRESNADEGPPCAEITSVVAGSDRSRQRPAETARVPTQATVEVKAVGSRDGDNTFSDLDRSPMIDGASGLGEAGTFQTNLSKTLRQPVFNKNLTFAHKSPGEAYSAERPPSTLRKNADNQTGATSPFGVKQFGGRLEFQNFIPSGAQTGADVSPDQPLRSIKLNQQSFAQGTLFRSAGATTEQQSTRGQPDSSVRIARSNNIQSSECTTYEVAQRMAQVRLNIEHKPALKHRDTKQTEGDIMPVIRGMAITNVQEVVSIGSSNADESKVYYAAAPHEPNYKPISPIGGQMASLLRREHRVFAVKDQLLMSGRSND